MNISPELIKGIIYIVIIIAIVIFLVKKAIGIAVCLGVMLLLFNIGYRFDGAEMQNHFQIDQYFDQETSQQIISFFDDFEQKREEFGIVDEDAVYDSMTDAIETGYYMVIDGLGKVDINKFAETLADNIYEAGLKDIDFNELVTLIMNELGISKEDAEKIALEVQENLQN